MLVTPISAVNWENRPILGWIIDHVLPPSLEQWVFEGFVKQPRWACNKRLRGAFDTLADSTRHWHPWAADHYARAIARGHDHPRATRTLGRAWSRVVWSCWQNRTPYDPTHHRALQQHALVTIPASSGPQPDTAATQRMLGTAVTQTAGLRPERNALDGKPTSANALGG